MRARYRVSLALLALGVAGCAVTLACELPGVVVTAGTEGALSGPGLVRVLPAGDRVLGGPHLPKVNDLAAGRDSVWLTGGTARQNHVLYTVDPGTGRVKGTTTLPSRPVINPGDLATGARAVWVAVGGRLYQIMPGRSGNTVTRPFATLPHGGLIGDMVSSPGSVWVDDATSGTVYRYPASQPGTAAVRPAAAITIGHSAGAMAAGDGGVWVADPDARTVSRISPARNRVDAVVATPGPPMHLTTAGHSLWATDGTADVTVIGAHGHIHTIPVGGQLTGLATGAGSVWVASTTAGTLTRIDPGREAVQATVPVGARPYAVAAGPQAVWVAVLGPPPMAHSPAHGSASSALGWLLRICG